MSWFITTDYHSPVVETSSRNDDGDGEVLGVGGVRVDDGPGLGQGSEVLLSCCGVVWIEWSNGSIRVGDQLGVGRHQETGEYLERGV